MSSSLNFLWKKDKSPNSDLYIDFLAIEGDEIPLSTIGLKYQLSNICVVEKNNTIAELIQAAGKESLEKGEYIAAMRLFNSSLGIAEYESDEEAKAYANRAKCFFHLNMPEECLTDIGMAKNSYCLDDSIKALDSYATKCKNLLKNEQFKLGVFNVREPILSFNEHQVFVGVADCLKIQKNLAFGHHVITKCDLEIGQTILVEQPYAISIGFSKGYNRCWNCFGENKNFISCKDCVGHLYCNEGCMKKSYHKYECNRTVAAQLENLVLIRKIFYKLNDAFPDVDHLMNTVDMMLNGKDTTSSTNAEQKAFCLLFQLVHNHEKLSQGKLRELRINAAKTYLAILEFQDYGRKYPKMKHRRFLQHLILHLFHIIEHAVDLVEYDQRIDEDSNSNHQFRYYAKGMYPFACQINHSCIPNVLWIPVGNRLVCKVIRPIQKGEQIFCSYFGSSVEPDQSLKTTLINRYHFTCECLLCSDKVCIPSKEEVKNQKPTVHRWKQSILHEGKRIPKIVTGGN